MKPISKPQFGNYDANIAPYTVKQLSGMNYSCAWRLITLYLCVHWCECVYVWIFAQAMADAVIK